MKVNIEEIPDFYKNYVLTTGGSGLIDSLENGLVHFHEILDNLSKSAGDFRYDSGKWSIKEMIQHIIDGERVFTYRALSFSRGDKTSLPGFEQDEWMAELDLSNRSLEDLVKEFHHTRTSTLDFYGSLTGSQFRKKGKASGVEFSVLGIGFITSGHLLHHLNVLEERYLPKLN